MANAVGNERASGAGLTFQSLKKKNATFSLPFEVDEQFRARARHMGVRSNELLTVIMCDYLCIPTSIYGIVRPAEVVMPPGDDGSDDPTA